MEIYALNINSFKSACKILMGLAINAVKGKLNEELVFFEYGKPRYIYNVKGECLLKIKEEL